MFNQSLSLVLLCFCVQCAASQDDPWTMTHAQRQQQEKEQRLARAAKECAALQQAIRDKHEQQRAAIEKRKRAEAEEKAFKIATRQARAPESSASSPVSPVPKQLVSPTAVADTQSVSIVSSPRLLSPLLTPVDVPSVPAGAGASQQVTPPSRNSSRRSSVSSWLQSPSSSCRNSTDSLPDSHSGNFSDLVALQRASQNNRSCIKRLFCCCDCG